MNEADYLRDRAQACHRMARNANLPFTVRELEAQAAEFERRAAELEARQASLR